MVSCSICGEPKRRVYCGSCTTHLTLRARVNVIKAISQVSSLRESVDNAKTCGAALADSLVSRIAALQAQLERTQQLTVETRNETARFRAEKQTASSQLVPARQSLRQRQVSMQNDEADFNNKLNKQISTLENDYVQLFRSSMALQTHCVRSLLDIFTLKKKRRKSTDYEFILGFNIVPELSQLAHYSTAVINSGFERVAYFLVFVASLLGVRLPFELRLPRKDQPHLQIGIDAEELFLPHSIKTLMRSNPREFHSYCRRLAMFALDTAHIGSKVGVPNVETPVASKISQLIAQIYLRLDHIVRSGHKIQVHAGSISTDVDTLQDILITMIDVEVNGRSAEWNIVEPLSSPPHSPQNRPPNSIQ